MGTLLLRLGGPIQSWAGYRIVANKHPVPTAAIPRKSGIAGLLGAALGRRDLDQLLGEFILHVRVDRTNAADTDLQVLTPWPTSKQHRADRAEKMRTATAGAKVPTSRTGGSLTTALVYRDFIPHAEFLVTLTGDTSDDWLEAVKRPQFMSYLGRRANPPTFPYILGTTPTEPLTLLETTPRVPRHDETAWDGAITPASARIYQVGGTYNQHEPQLLKTLTPETTSREGQLEWASQHLQR